MQRYVNFLLFILLLILTQVTCASNPPLSDRLTGDWNGARQKLQDKGLDIGVEWRPEFFDNFQGGKHKGQTGASTLDLNLTLDTEKAFGWKQGEFYIEIEDHEGKDPTTALVGDLQIFDIFNFSPYFEIFEFWYQQTLWNEKLRLKFGKVDANTEFSVIENSVSLLNSSTQTTPTILSFPTTPDPVLSANLFFTPIKSWFLSLGLYDANQRDRFGIFYGHPQSALITRNGEIFLSESGIKWGGASILKTGNFKLGFWEHTGTFNRFDGGTQNGAIGLYTLLNQTLWQPKGASEKGKGLRGFFSYGHTQESVGIIDWNYSTGLAWTGIFPKRDNDILGVSANYAHISDQANSLYPYELALELNYKIIIYRGIFLLPDFQYIIHPGGKYPNAQVGTLHMKIEF